MKHQPPPLTVGTPCSKQWENLRGDATKRFCEHCALHVHNLSVMTRRERRRFLEESGGKECIAYQLRPDGTMITPSFWSTLFRPFLRIQFATVTLLTALLPFLFSSCATRRILGKIACHDHSDRNAALSINECAMTLGAPLPPAPRNADRTVRGR